MGRKEGGGFYAPFAVGEMGPRLTQCGLGQDLLPYQVTSTSIQPFGQNRHGPKIGRGNGPFFWGSPSNTKSPGPRSTSIPSGILVHPAVWPQRTWAENWRLCPFSGGGLSAVSCAEMAGLNRSICQTVRRIKMKLSTQVGLNHGYVLLNGDPAPPKGTQPPIFGPRPLCQTV